MKKKVFKSQSGFTLIELIVSMMILGILAVIGLGNFRNAQLKSRDARRKSDLEQIQRALEMYFNDTGSYPTSSAGQLQVSGTTIAWGNELVDSKGTLYMKVLPKDPGSVNYCYSYEVGPPRGYKLYAQLENGQDPSCFSGNCAAGHSCNSRNYNYGVASPNLVP